MRCSVCGQDVPITYSLDGGELCHDCLMDVAEDPQLVEDKLPDFIAQHIKEYVDWVCNTTEGGLLRHPGLCGEGQGPGSFGVGVAKSRFLSRFCPGLSH